MRQAAKDRAELAGMPGETLSELAAKRNQLATVQEGMSLISRYADLLAAASLAEAGRGVAGLNIASHKALTDIRRITTGEPGAGEQAKHHLHQWLGTDLPSDGFPRALFHWPLVFPEVFDAGGFNAVIGNPPFLGGTIISGRLGSAYRSYLGTAIAEGSADRCDLAGYFVLRAYSLITDAGNLALITTNSISQGDTREVSLDTVVDSGGTIIAAVKSRKWPSKSANVSFASITISRTQPADGYAYLLDDRQVRGITTLLEERSRAVGRPFRLQCNHGRAFEGCKLTGEGFILDEEEAGRLLHDAGNEEIIRPYLVGDDLNGRPDSSASRWAIDFNDMGEASARRFSLAFQLVEERVRPQRQRTKPDGSFVLREPLPTKYWQYGDKRTRMRTAIDDLRRVIVFSVVSKIVLPTLVRTGQIFSNRLIVIASDDPGELAILSSAIHYHWAVQYSSTLESRTNYTTSDAFETFPFPPLSNLRELGNRLDTFRRDLMLSRQSGLTATYNLVNDASCTDADIVELRGIHRLIDEAVCRECGWYDLLGEGLDHGFHDTRQGVRYTVGPVVRQEILDRLLELNHERYAAEQSSGAVGKRKTAHRSEQPELFG